MRLIQITDLHVGLPEDDTSGVDVRKNCERILQKAAELEPDQLIFTGDLCFRGPEPEIYGWLKPRIDQLGLPCSFIPGNHDDTELMCNTFDLPESIIEGEYYYRKDWEGRPVLFLDSAVAEFSVRQMEWLREQLLNCRGPVLLFIHHPPVYAGVPFMDDNHAFRQMNLIQEILHGYPGEISIFCGHYHVDKIVRKRNLLVHVTPSCYLQIDQHQADFKVDHYRIGLREIILHEDSLLSTVHYLEGAKKETA